MEAQKITEQPIGPVKTDEEFASEQSIGPLKPDEEFALEVVPV